MGINQAIKQSRNQASRAEMKQLREIAESYYEASSGEVKAKVTKFFRSMDDDGDGKVDLEEFLTFMRNEGYVHMRNNSFFKELDETGHGLSFVDVITLYYIIKSGRPFCDSCAAFIPGIFFSCVRCFNNPKTAFNICPHCYRSDRCKHSHDGGGGRGRALFLDNYTLLQATRIKPTSTTIINQPRTPPVWPVPASKNFATALKKNKFKCIDAQSQWGNRPLKLLASKDVATTSVPVQGNVSPRILRRTKGPATSTKIVPATKPQLSFAFSHRRTKDPVTSTAIVLATKPPGKWTDIASVSFKALDKLLAVGNLVGVVAAGVSACTIM